MWWKTERMHESEFERNEWYTISHCAANLTYVFVRKAAGYHSSGGEATGEKVPATKLKPVTYALTRSFSHVRYEISHTPSSPIGHNCAVTVVSTPKTVTKGAMGDEEVRLIPCTHAWVLTICPVPFSGQAILVVKQSARGLLACFHGILIRHLVSWSMFSVRKSQ